MMITALSSQQAMAAAQRLPAQQPRRCGLARPFAAPCRRLVIVRATTVSQWERARGGACVGWRAGGGAAAPACGSF